MIKKAKNVTFRIQEDLLKKARAKALKEHQSLNKLVSQWLKNYAAGKGQQMDYMSFMAKLDNIKIGKKFTREEMNER